MAHMMKRIAVFLLLAYGDTAYGQNECLVGPSSKCTPWEFVFLSYCGITDADIPDLVACFDSIGRSDITYLALGNNELTTLPSDLFEGMGALWNLHLHANQFTTIPEAIFSLDSLGFLNLSGNQLTSIPSGSFDAAEGLRALTLDENPITSIGEGAFPLSLTYLNLRLLDLSTVPAGPFDNLGALQQLTMNGGSIEAIEPGAFDDLVAIIYLELQDNQLETLPSNLFAAMGQLERLHLSDNNLSKLPVDAFAGLSSAELVFLDNNALTTLPEGIFKDLGSGEGGVLWSLHLDGNPDLQCIPEVYLTGEEVYYTYSGYGYSWYTEDLPETPGMCECTPVEAVTCAVGTTCIPGEEGFTCDEGSNTCSSLAIGGIEGSNDNGSVCCPIGCNQCGGAGCGSSGAAEGLTSEDCCINGVLNNQDLCSSTMAAPCVIDGSDACSSLGIDGIEGSNDNGSVCCPLGCNQCGGAGCGSSGSAEGLTNEDCCINGVLNNQDACSESGTAPCVL